MMLIESKLYICLILISLLLILNSSLLTLSSLAQTYPVTVQTILTPPYSLNLSDYVQPGMQRLTVQIRVNDLNVSNLPVRLHIKMESAGITVETNPNIPKTPFFINGGAVHILSGHDLIEYFNADNMLFKGYSRENYRRSGQLPDGFWKISVQVIHYATGRAVSNAGSSSVWIAIGKPPQLRTPLNDAEMGMVTGVPLTFSWLNNNAGVPGLGGRGQYTFEMWELRMPGVDPYVIAASMPPFYTTTVTNTTFVLNTAMLLMEPGMRYAWRVTAFDPAGLIPFNQDGRSEVRTFAFQSRCDAVTGLTGSTTYRRATFQWEKAANHTSFNVEAKNPGNGWQSITPSYNTKVTWDNLDFGVVYEVRVQSVCNNGLSTGNWSEWITMRVPERRVVTVEDCPDCGCGDMIPPKRPTNFELRNDLQPGDTIMEANGATRYIIKSATPQGDGSYKGIFLFLAEVWGVRFTCEYWNLKVNTDNEIIRVGYESIYNPAFLHDIDEIQKKINDLANDIATITKDTRLRDSIKIHKPIDDIYTGDK